jgi:protein associated with RNAse G/E
MENKTQHSLAILSLVSLMAINYYVSSSTVKYDLTKKENVKISEDKKIDKVEPKEFAKHARKKINKPIVQEQVVVAVPSLFEMSRELGVPIIIQTGEELSYPE